MNHDQGRSGRRQRGRRDRFAAALLAVTLGLANFIARAPAAEAVNFNSTPSPVTVSSTESDVIVQVGGDRIAGAAAGAWDNKLQNVVLGLFDAETGGNLVFLAKSDADGQAQFHVKEPSGRCLNNNAQTGVATYAKASRLADGQPLTCRYSLSATTNTNLATAANTALNSGPQAAHRTLWVRPVTQTHLDAANLTVQNVYDTFGPAGSLKDGTWTGAPDGWRFLTQMSTGPLTQPNTGTWITPRNYAFSVPAATGNNAPGNIASGTLYMSWGTARPTGVATSIPFARIMPGSSGNSTQTADYKASSGTFVLARDNSAMPDTCKPGFKVALIIDTSASMLSTTGSFGTYSQQVELARAAANELITAFTNTSVEMQLFSFGTAAETNSALTKVTPEGAAQLKSLIGSGGAVENRNGEYRTVNTAPGTPIVFRSTNYTNWDAALWTVANTSNQFDVAILVTDGLPTVYGTETGTGNSSGRTRFFETERAIEAANALKAKGTHIEVLGAGGALAASTGTDATGKPIFTTDAAAAQINMPHLAGPGAVHTANWDEAARVLRYEILKPCLPALTVVKYERPWDAPESAVMKAAVANKAALDALPPAGNTLNDGRITLDDGELYVWTGSPVAWEKVSSRDSAAPNWTFTVPVAEIKGDSQAKPGNSPMELSPGTKEAQQTDMGGAAFWKIDAIWANEYGFDPDRELADLKVIETQQDGFTLVKQPAAESKFTASSIEADIANYQNVRCVYISQYTSSAAMSGPFGGDLVGTGPGWLQSEADWTSSTFISATDATANVTVTAIAGRTPAIGQYVRSTAADSLGRYGRITSVTSATRVTVEPVTSLLRSGVPTAADWNKADTDPTKAKRLVPYIERSGGADAPAVTLHDFSATDMIKCSFINKTLQPLEFPLDVLIGEVGFTGSHVTDFDWNVVKTADRREATVAQGQDATFEYTLDVSADPHGSGREFQASGSVEIKNPNDSGDLSLADVLIMIGGDQIDTITWTAQLPARAWHGAGNQRPLTTEPTSKLADIVLQPGESVVLPLHWSSDVPPPLGQITAIITIPYTYPWTMPVTIVSGGYTAQREIIIRNPNDKPLKLADAALTLRWPVKDGVCPAGSTVVDGQCEQKVTQVTWTAATPRPTGINVLATWTTTTRLNSSSTTTNVALPTGSTPMLNDLVVSSNASSNGQFGRITAVSGTSVTVTAVAAGTVLPNGTSLLADIEIPAGGSIKIPLVWTGTVQPTGSVVTANVVIPRTMELTHTFEGVDAALANTTAMLSDEMLDGLAPIPLDVCQAGESGPGWACVLDPRSPATGKYVAVFDAQTMVTGSDGRLHALLTYTTSLGADLGPAQCHTYDNRATLTPAEPKPGEQPTGDASVTVCVAVPPTASNVEIEGWRGVVRNWVIEKTVTKINGADVDHTSSEYHPAEEFPVQLLVTEKFADLLGLPAGDRPAIVQIADGGFHTVALDEHGNVWNWGRKNGADEDSSNAIEPVLRADGTVLNLGTGTDIAVAAGYEFAAALDSAGRVWTWGDAQNGALGNGSTADTARASQVDFGATKIKLIALGDQHALAVDTDGWLWAWGNNASGRVGHGTFDEDFYATPVEVISDPITSQQLGDIVAIAAGFEHSLAVDSAGNVWTWGVPVGLGGFALPVATRLSNFVPLAALPAGGFTAVAAGDSQSLALAVDGNVWAWGINSARQVTGTAKPTLGAVLPAKVENLPATGISAIAARGLHSHALANDGTLWAWGEMLDGQPLDLGLGPVQVPIPGDTAATQHILQISAGQNDIHAVAEAGVAWAWGSDGDGQLGTSRTNDYWTALAAPHCSDGASTSKEACEANSASWLENAARLDYGITARPRPESSQVRLTGSTLIDNPNRYDVMAGLDLDFTATGVDTSNIFCTMTTAPDLTVIDALPGSLGIEQISDGGLHTLARASDGTVWAWGQNDSGQLGHGDFANATTAQQVFKSAGVPLDDITAIGAGYAFSIALDSAGNVWAWGNNAYGQLGDGAKINSEYAVPAILADIAVISAGDQHAMALDTAGSVWAWGNNASGRLGDGSTVSRSTPVKVADHMSAIAAGYEHSMALTASGQVWTWGRNNVGQLGNPAVVGNALVPTAVPGLSGIAKIATGDDFSLALTTTGTVWAWGDNSYGQLGDGTTTMRPQPKLIPTLTGIGAIAAGKDVNGGHTHALSSDGTRLWAWGDNSEGALGTDSDAKTLTPTEVDLHGLALASITAGDGYSHAVTKSGLGLAWGSDSAGKLGGGSYWQLAQGANQLEFSCEIDLDAIKPELQEAYLDSLATSAAKLSVTVNWLGLDGKSAAGPAVDSNPFAWRPSTEGDAMATIHVADNFAGQPIPGSWQRIDGPGPVSGDNWDHACTWSDPSANTPCHFVYQLDLPKPTNGQLVADYTNVARIVETRQSDEETVEVPGGNKLTVATTLSGTISGALPWKVNKQAIVAPADGTRVVDPEPEICIPKQTGDNPPQRIAGTCAEILSISAGGWQTIAVTKNDPGIANGVWVWGRNHRGQLSLDPAVTPFTEVPLETMIDYRYVAGIAQGTAAAAGFEHSLVLTNFGDVWVAGRNNLGQLGDGLVTSAVTKAQPISFPTDNYPEYYPDYLPYRKGVDSEHFPDDKKMLDIVLIAAGDDHNLAMDELGYVWAWGSNSDGQLGNVSIGSFSETPVLVMTDEIDPNTGKNSPLRLTVPKNCLWADASSLPIALRPADERGANHCDLHGTMLAAGWQHSLALDDEHVVWAWGANSTGQLGIGNVASQKTPKKVAFPAFATSADGSQSRVRPIAIDAGDEHSLALDDANRVWAWGANAQGQLGLGPLEHTRRTTPAQVPLSVGTEVYAIAAGGQHSHAIAKIAGGTPSLYVAGADLAGQPSAGGQHTPLPLPDGYQLVASDNAFAEHGNAAKALAAILTVGDQHSHALVQKTCDGSDPECTATIALHSWGDNAYGQLGFGGNPGSSGYWVVPAPDPGSTVTVPYQITVTPANKLLETPKLTGTVKVTNENSTPLLVGLELTDTFLNDDIICRISEESDSVGSEAPLPNNQKAVQVSAGGEHSLAVAADGTVYAWGRNQFGQIGDGSTDNALDPVQVKGLADIVAVAAGFQHSLALDKWGNVYAWGRNQYGQLGNGNTIASPVPVKITTLTGIAGIGVGDDHSLAFDGDGALWAWGNNSLGQLGNRKLGETTTYSATPVKVMVPTNPAWNRTSYDPLEWQQLTGIVQVTGGWQHSIAMTGPAGNHAVYTWGDNTEGQLGFGTRVSTNVPTVADPPHSTLLEAGDWSGPVAGALVAAGDEHSLVLDQDGQLWAVGSNSAGQLGRAVGERTLAPVHIALPTLDPIIAIGAGGENSHAVTCSDPAAQVGTQCAGVTTLWTWGGDLGGPDPTTPFPYPNPNPDASFVIMAVEVGDGHALALMSNGQVQGRGDNVFGQLGRLNRWLIPAGQTRTLPFVCDGVDDAAGGEVAARITWDADEAQTPNSEDSDTACIAQPPASPGMSGTSESAGSSVGQLSESRGSDSRGTVSTCANEWLTSTDMSTWPGHLIQVHDDFAAQTPQNWTGVSGPIAADDQCEWNWDDQTKTGEPCVFAYQLQLAPDQWPDATSYVNTVVLRQDGKDTPVHDDEEVDVVPADLEAAVELSSATDLDFDWKVIKQARPGFCQADDAQNNVDELARALMTVAGFVADDPENRDVYPTEWPTKVADARALIAAENVAAIAAKLMQADGFDEADDPLGYRAELPTKLAQAAAMTAARPPAPSDGPCAWTDSVAVQPTVGDAAVDFEYRLLVVSNLPNALAEGGWPIGSVTLTNENPFEVPLTEVVIYATPGVVFTPPAGYTMSPDPDAVTMCTDPALAIGDADCEVAELVAWRFDDTSDKLPACAAGADPDAPCTPASLPVAVSYAGTEAPEQVVVTVSTTSLGRVLDDGATEPTLATMTIPLITTEIKATDRYVVLSDTWSKYIGAVELTDANGDPGVLPLRLDAFDHLSGGAAYYYNASVGAHPMCIDGRLDAGDPDCEPAIDRHQNWAQLEVEDDPDNPGLPCTPDNPDQSRSYDDQLCRDLEDDAFVFLDELEDLTVALAVAPSFDRAYPWSLTKQVCTGGWDPSGGNADGCLGTWADWSAGDAPAVTAGVGPDGNATFHYRVTATVGDPNDTGRAIIATATFTNPNAWDVLVDDVTVTLDGLAGAATYTCTADPVGQNPDGTWTVPGSTEQSDGTAEVTANCVVELAPGAALPDATANVAAPWHARTADTVKSTATNPAPVPVVWPTPAGTSSAGGQITVADDQTVAGAWHALGTCTPEQSPCVFAYPMTLAGPDAASLATTYHNIARIPELVDQCVGTDPCPYRDEVEVEVTHLPLTVSAQLNGEYTLAYAWQLDKVLTSAPRVEVAAGQSAQFSYELRPTVTAKDYSSITATGGVIVVANPNDFPVAAADVTIDAPAPLVYDGPFVGGVKVPAVPARGSAQYVLGLPTGARPGGALTVTITAEGALPTTITLEFDDPLSFGSEIPEPAEIFNQSVTLHDTFPEFGDVVLDAELVLARPEFYVQTYTVSRSVAGLPLDAEGCGLVQNTASLIAAAQVLDSDAKSALVCPSAPAPIYDAALRIWSQSVYRLDGSGGWPAVPGSDFGPTAPTSAKAPIEVQTGDAIEYAIELYNQGNAAIHIDELTFHSVPGLRLATEAIHPDQTNADWTDAHWLTSGVTDRSTYLPLDNDFVLQPGTSQRLSIIAVVEDGIALADACSATEPTGCFEVFAEISQISALAAQLAPQAALVAPQVALVAPQAAHIAPQAALLLTDASPFDLSSLLSDASDFAAAAAWCDPAPTGVGKPAAHLPPGYQPVCDWDSEHHDNNAHKDHQARKDNEIGQQHRFNPARDKDNHDGDLGRVTQPELPTDLPLDTDAKLNGAGTLEYVWTLDKCIWDAVKHRCVTDDEVDKKRGDVQPGESATFSYALNIAVAKHRESATADVSWASVTNPNEFAVPLGQVTRSFAGLTVKAIEVRDDVTGVVTAVAADPPNVPAHSSVTWTLGLADETAIPTAPITVSIGAPGNPPTTATLGFGAGDHFEPGTAPVTVKDGSVTVHDSMLIDGATVMHDALGRVFNGGPITAEQIRSGAVASPLTYAMPLGDKVASGECEAFPNEAQLLTVEPRVVEPSGTSTPQNSATADAAVSDRDDRVVEPVTEPSAQPPADAFTLEPQTLVPEPTSPLQPAQSPALELPNIELPGLNPVIEPAAFNPMRYRAANSLLQSVAQPLAGKLRAAETDLDVLASDLESVTVCVPEIPPPPTWCEEHPTDPRCVEPKPFCEEHPTDPRCVEPKPFCEEHPTDPRCVEPKPFCEEHPTDPRCVEPKPFCELHPTDSRCVEPKPFCEEHPTDPRCVEPKPFCEEHPTDPRCVEPKPFCEEHPTDPRCQTPKTFCELHPTDSRCVQPTTPTYPPRTSNPPPNTSTTPPNTSTTPPRTTVPPTTMPTAVPTTERSQLFATDTPEERKLFHTGTSILAICLGVGMVAIGAYLKPKKGRHKGAHAIE